MDLETAEQIKEYLLSGKSYYEAEAEFCHSIQTIQYWFKQFSIHISQKELYKKRSILADEIPQIVAMYKAGYYQKEIIEALQTNHWTINKALRARGIKIEKKWALMTDKEAAKTNRFLKNGLTSPQVSEKIGVSTNTIHNYFKTYMGGIPATDFKPTQADYDYMVDMLIDGKSKDKIATKLETRKLFISLMISVLGSHTYFAEKITKQTYHKLTETDLLFFIQQRFQGISTSHLSGVLNTSRPTLDLLTSR